MSLQDVIDLVTEVRERLSSLEQLVVTESGLAKARLGVSSFSVKDMANRVHSILKTKVFRTFPEQYRWKED